MVPYTMIKKPLVILLLITHQNLPILHGFSLLSSQFFLRSVVPPFSREKRRALFSYSSAMAAPRGTAIKMGLRGKRRRAEIRQLKQQATPAYVRTPYGPIRPQSRPRMCMTCAGRGRIRCPICEGKGHLPATGHAQRYNKIHQPIVGSRWTSVLIREGHRQYTVSETKGSPKKGNKKDMQVRMSNCCGPEEDRVHIWITLQELRDKNVWRAGWTTLQDIIMADHGALLDIKECFRCKGETVVECPECGGIGQGRQITTVFSFARMYNHTFLLFKFLT